MIPSRVRLLSFETGADSTQPNTRFTLSCQCSGHEKSCPLPAKPVSDVFREVFSSCISSRWLFSAVADTALLLFPFAQGPRGGSNNHTRTRSGATQLFG